MNADQKQTGMFRAWHWNVYRQAWQLWHENSSVSYSDALTTANYWRTPLTPCIAIENVIIFECVA
jgi:hypothetical protein